MRVRTRGLWMRPAARRVESQAAVSPPEVHLKPAGSPRRVRELGRVDRDRYAWTCVGGGSKWRGRLSVTVGRKAVARRARSRSCVHERGREGVKGPRGAPVPPLLRRPSGSPLSHGLLLAPPAAAMWTPRPSGAQRPPVASNPWMLRPHFPGWQLVMMPAAALQLMPGRCRGRVRS